MSLSDPIPIPAEQIPSIERWIITVAVMLVAVIEVLDVTIVNVSLNQMMGSFGATTDEITWILTAYLVSAAIFMPLTGLLVKYFGRRRLLLINIIGFMIASMLCGAAQNLPQIVFFRILQGIFGASLVPISQYVLRDTFPREQQGKAMAIWGIGIMVGPVLGPTLGGYITEALNWRWVFYINVPFCILAWIMSVSFIRESVREDQSIDWFGLLLMASGVGAFQTFLDRGNNDNWFESRTILILFIISVTCLGVFISRGWNKDDNIINLKLFKERHFALSTLILTVYALAIFGSVMLQPLMLESLIGYPPDLAGEIMAPRGLASAFSMMVVSQISKKADSRIFILIGILLTIFGTYLMTYFDIYGSPFTYILPGIIQGFGMGFVIVPLSSGAFDFLNKSQIPEAAGLFSFGRSMGVSIGISILTTVLTRESQANWFRLSEKIQWGNPIFTHWASAQGGDPHSSLIIAIAAKEVQTQSAMLAFVNAFLLAALILALMIPFVFLLKKSKDHLESSVEHSV